MFLYNPLINSCQLSKMVMLKFSGSNRQPVSPLTENNKIAGNLRMWIMEFVIMIKHPVLQKDFLPTSLKLSIGKLFDVNTSITKITSTCATYKYLKTYDKYYNPMKVCNLKNASLHVHSQEYPFNHNIYVIIKGSCC